METVKYQFRSLEDYLISRPLTVDGMLNDGWGAYFPVKGREIEATILFSDISGFSRRTRKLTSTETLIFVNNFFSWVTAEALRGSHGIVDKYIGDELMIVFSKEFGSKDPFLDALQAARWMGEHDVMDFSPHIGIASGPVTVGYVGTPIKFSCSVFGAAVALAARCGSVRPNLPKNTGCSTAMVFPAAEWGNRKFDEVIPSIRSKAPDGEITEEPHSWELLDPWQTPMKNLPDVEVRAIVNSSFRINNFTVEDRCRYALEELRKAGRYPMS